VDSNLVESNGFLMVIKIHSMTSFGGQVKLSTPCCESLWRILKNPAEYERDASLAKFTAISCQVSPNLVLGVFAATRAENSGG
jgi:hypothetical protein